MMASLSVARNMRLADLRHELEGCGLDNSGTNAQLLGRLAEYLDSGSAARERLTPSVAQQPSQAGSTQSSSLELPLRDIIREEVRAALLVPQASQPTHLSASSPAGVAATIPLDTADCLPPSGKKTFHAFLPKSLHDKIVSGQFVEFGLLLQSSNQTDPSRTFLQMNQGKDGGNLIVANTSRPSRRIEDFDTWLEAWTNFGAIYAMAHPSRAHELFSTRTKVRNSRVLHF